MKIHLKLNGQVVAATLADNPAARAFAAMLPLAITMHDLFNREKFGPLPGAIPGRRTKTRSRACEVGDMICWAAGPDLAIFHRHDGQKIKGGFHVLGKLDGGAQAFSVPGPLEVRIEAAGGDEGRAAGTGQRAWDAGGAATPVS